MIPKKRLRSDEFSKLVKDYPEVENLIYALNQTRDETAKTLDSRLSIKQNLNQELKDVTIGCLLYTSPSPRDRQKSRMPSSA